MEFTENPKVTVLMSVYNGEKYLREAIESILNQTFTDFEFIIINDGSTDSSRSIIQSYNDSRIRLIDNERNIGLTSSLNNGIDLANGEYIARMDADDISLPERFEKQIEYMDANPDIAVCGGWAYVIDKENKLLYEAKMETSKDLLFANLFLGNQLVHASAIIRASILKINKYSTKFKSAQDYNLWFRLLNSGYVITNIPFFVINYRDHSCNISNIVESEQEKYAVLAVKTGFQDILNIDTTVKKIALLRNCANDKQKIISKKEYNVLSDLLNRMKDELLKKINNLTTQEYLQKRIDDILGQLKINKKNYLQHLVYCIKENYDKKIRSAFI